MSDIRDRLRSLADCDARAGEPLGKCMREAADELDRFMRWSESCDREIAALRAEVERLNDLTRRMGNIKVEMEDECGRLRAEIARLRAVDDAMVEAAAREIEIAALRAENERLRADFEKWDTIDCATCEELRAEIARLRAVDDAMVERASRTWAAKRSDGVIMFDDMNDDARGLVRNTMRAVLTAALAERDRTEGR